MLCVFLGHRRSKISIPVGSFSEHIFCTYSLFLGLLDVMKLPFLDIYSLIYLCSTCVQSFMLIDLACREQEVKRFFLTMLLRAKETGP